MVILSTLLQRILRAILGTLHAQNAFRSVLAFSRIVGHVHIHRAYCFTFAAGDTFLPVAFDPE